MTSWKTWGRSSRRIFENVLVQGLTSDCDQVKFAFYRDSSYLLEQIRATMGNLYLDDLSRKNSARSRIIGRGVATTRASRDMSTTTHLNATRKTIIRWIADSRRKNTTSGISPQHEELRPVEDHATQAFERSIKSFKHRFTIHNDADCYRQGAPRPQKSAHISRAASDLNVDATPFNGDLLLANIAPESCTYGGTTAFLLFVDSDTTDHYLDDELIPGLRDRCST